MTKEILNDKKKEYSSEDEEKDQDGEQLQEEKQGKSKIRRSKRKEAENF